MMQHRLPTRLFLWVSCLILIIGTGDASALVKKASSSSAKKTAQSSKSRPGKKDKKGQKKHVPYILAPKTPEIVAPKEPHPHHFSPELSDALARDDLNQAYRHLQLEEASDKVGYMINQVLMAQGKGASHGRSLSAFDRATAYHNLYLFLARQGRPAPRFLKDTVKYYQKAARKTGYGDKTNVLLAAIYATANDRKRSEKYFGKVDVAALTRNGEDYNGLEYLATYHAATRQTQEALADLDKAYRLNPGSLLQWLHVGDDFWMIEEDEAFRGRVASWKAEHHQRLAQLQRDKSTHDARKKAALTKKTKKRGSGK